MTVSWVAFTIVTAVLIYGIVIYNRLVSLKNQGLAAWSDIDVQLKRRHDLIPKLVAAVQQYADYEQSTLTAVTELRMQSESINGPTEKGRLEANLGQSLQRLIAVAENYPQLKANQNFLSLQQDISGIENDIQHARRYYNGSIRLLNTRIESFPDLIVAHLLGFQYGQYFQLEED
jgi:LemA protein